MVPWSGDRVEPARPPCIGLVCTGGGARAAYQAGVLRGIAELRAFPKVPFEILTGVSAGAINCTALAGDADMDFEAATQALWEYWENVKTEDVFKTDFVSLLGIGSRWIRDLSMGGLFKSSHVTNLLDTAPLRGFLRSKIRFDRFRAHIEAGRIKGVAVSATNYFSGTAVTFFDGAPEIAPWYRSTRIAMREALTLEHVMASAAIPVFFPPVRLSGSYYGDGCVRLTAPLSPAIHMGSDRVLAIGIRHFREQTTTQFLNKTVYAQEISLGDITGVLLNAVFLDSLETDLERVTRINRTVQGLSQAQKEAHPDHLREIPILAIKPSRDLGTLASEQFDRFPKTLRHLLRGLGASDEKGWDLLSYLAFEGAYTKRLLQLGFEDALNQKEKILAILDPAPVARGVTS
jgi:NTE family protein